jgi:hypothetical protein
MVACNPAGLSHGGPGMIAVFFLCCPLKSRLFLSHTSEYQWKSILILSLPTGQIAELPIILPAVRGISHQCPRAIESLFDILVDDPDTPGNDASLFLFRERIWWNVTEQVRK